MRTKILYVVLLLLGILSAYLLYEPVPDGITEPSKYRVVAAGMRLVKHLVYVAHLVHRDEPFESYHNKWLRHILDSASPTPQAEVEGSNIRSKVTQFDGVTVRLYEPITREDDSKIPAFIYIHGGGLCIGSADAFDVLTRKVAEGLDIVLVSIDYRLAPEHPHPSGLEDCLTATRYVLQHADDFGVDRHRIGIGGDSSGGHLSASVAQVIHDDEDVPDLKLQVLIYPWLQKIDLNTPSYQKYAADFGDAGTLPLSLLATFLTLSFGSYDHYAVSQFMTNNFTSPEFKKQSLEYSYVSHEHIPAEFRDPRYYKTRNDLESGDSALWARLSDGILNPRFSPLLRRDLSGLPQALILTVGFDTLRDDGIFYKKRLENDGVPVTFSHYEEGFHGLIAIPNFKLAVTMINDLIAYVRTNI